MNPPYAKEHADLLNEISSHHGAYLMREAIDRLGIRTRKRLVEAFTTDEWSKTGLISRAARVSFCHMLGLPCEPPKRKLRSASILRFGSRLSRMLKVRPIPVKVVAAVYALTRGDRIMYVGQTTHLISRIGRHLTDKPQFDGVRFFIVKRHPTNTHLLQLESAVIASLNPPWNPSRHPKFRN